MEWADLLKWFFIAGAVACVVVLRSKRKTGNAQPEEIEGLLPRRFASDLAPQELRDSIERAMEAAGCTLHSANKERLVYDSKSIGLFHWGFLYLVDLPSDAPGTAVISIFGKGPNPPTPCKSTWMPSLTRFETSPCSRWKQTDPGRL